MSLAPVAPCLSRLLGRPVAFAQDCVGEPAEKAVAAMMPGDVLLLENVRFEAGEEKNDEELGKRLAALCDVYVNDAFATAHRAHASNVAIVKHVKERAAGLLMKNEIAHFEKALVSPARPLSAIFGGAKISGKIEAINNVLGKVDKILIGGAMANTFLAAMGHGIGKSLYEAGMVDTAKRVLAGAAERKSASICRSTWSWPSGSSVRADPTVPGGTDPRRNDGARHRTRDVRPVPRGASGREDDRVERPDGGLETAPFAAGTQAVMRALADSNALTIVGGGDTDTALHKAGLFSRMSYVSTGGGAFLELLEGKHLPGIAALEEVYPGHASDEERSIDTVRCPRGPVDGGTSRIRIGGTGGEHRPSRPPVSRERSTGDHGRRIRRPAPPE